MKTKQLANVLIKIFGLSLFITGILAFVGGLLELPQISRGMPWQATLSVFGHGIVQLAIGIYLMAKSKDITGFLFKDDDE